MEKPQFYDEVQANTGDFVTLQPGAYVCEIKNAVFAKAEKTKNDMLVLLLDIAEGEYKGYFQKRFDGDTRVDRKWGCVLRIIVDDPSKNDEDRKKIVARLKGAISSIELSNPNFAFDWAKPETAKGKLIGATFGLEEYVAQDGKTKTIAKVRAARSVEGVRSGKCQMPQVKLLDGKGYMDYDEYLDKKFDEANDTESDFVTVSDKDDLPF